MGEYDAFVCVCVAFSIWHEKSFTIRRASIQLCDLYSAWNLIWNLTQESKSVYRYIYMLYFYKIYTYFIRLLSSELYSMHIYTNSENDFIHCCCCCRSYSKMWQNKCSKCTWKLVEYNFLCINTF